MADLLLCTESNKNLCFDDEVDDLHVSHLNLDFDDVNVVGSEVEAEAEAEADTPFSCLTLLPDDCEFSFDLMIEREKEHLPRDDYLFRLRTGELDLSFRREAIDWILKAHSYYRYGSLSVCLAVNYLDRFLSVYELPRGKAWTVQLLAVACFSLAAKVVEINVPLTIDLQVGDPKYLFEGKTIKRMELLVMNSLNWRMQACTPFSFIDYFLGKLNNDQFPSQPLISKAIQLILSTIKGIDFLEFKPSEVSAAVAMLASGDKQAMGISSSFTKVDKVRLMKCIELMEDLTMNSGFTSTSATSGVMTRLPQSPNGVLEAATCLSYKSDERTVGSCPSSSHTSPDPKRRKF